jgi:integrase
MDANFFLFWPDAKKVKAAGFKSLAHVPCVFDAHWRYQRIPSVYLCARARAKLERKSNRPALHAVRYPTVLSLRAFGEALINFLEWCAENGRPWEVVDYDDDIVSGYQEDMLSGAWSARRSALSARTINARVGEACRFLEWAASVHLREPFEILTTKVSVDQQSGTSTHGHKRKTVEVRVGGIRPNPLQLRIPTDAEVDRWGRSVRAESGYTKSLMCRAVLETAVRREELVQWRIDTLPIDKTQWRVEGDSVMVTISYGAKGSKRRNESGDLVGPSRDIVIPLSLAESLHEYYRTIRPALRKKFVYAGGTEAERRRRMKLTTTRLFLSEATGLPVSAQRFYEAWTGASALPFAGWSPHGGRHWWSCKKLLKAVKRLEGIGALAPSYSDGDSMLTASATDVIRLVIKPQLGHLDEKTSEAYLVWVRRIVELATLYDDYERELEDVTSQED